MAMHHEEQEPEPDQPPEPSVKDRLRQMNVDEIFDVANSTVFPDLGEALFAESHDDQFAVAIDAAFRATTAV